MYSLRQGRGWRKERKKGTKERKDCITGTKTEKKYESVILLLSGRSPKKKKHDREEYREQKENPASGVVRERGKKEQKTMQFL